MPLTQMQIIQSLGEAMAWFERELAWGVPAAELRHLSGRIGELYAALITNGQMATEVNQKGYDVVAQNGDRVSVKTTTMMNQSGHVSVNSNTLSLVDRLMILRINTEEMQIEILFNDTIDVAGKLMAPATNDRQNISLSKLSTANQRREKIPAIESVNYKDYVVEALESGTIQIFQNDKTLIPVKPILRILAAELGLSLLNSNGKEYNTRQLGTNVIRAVQSLLSSK